MATVTPSRPAPRRPKPPRNRAQKAETSARRRANTRLPYDIAGIVLTAFGLLLLGTLLSRGAQSGENVVGTSIVRGLRLFVGVGAWGFPVLLFALGGMLALGRSRSWDNAGAAVGLFVAFLGWWHLGHVAGDYLFVRDNLLSYGGYVGAMASWALLKLFGSFGAHVAFAALSIVGALLLVDIPLPSLLAPFEKLVGRGAQAGKVAAKKGAKTAKEKMLAAAERRREEFMRQASETDGDESDENDPAEPAAPTVRARAAAPSAKRQSSDSSPERFRPRFFPKREGASDGESVSDAEASDADTEENGAARGVPIPVQPSLFQVRRSAPIDVDATEDSGASEIPASDEPIVSAPVAAKKTPAPPAKPAVKPFVLPPTSLLKIGDPAPVLASGRVSDERKRVLLQTLEDFGIGADIAEVAYGPTITRYEVALDRGIKVSKIVSLADNLAMALAAMDVRVEAPIPGKSAIGIEVPNEKPQLVTLRDVLESPEFKSATGRLVFALGKDVTGKCRFADLSKMPHLLVAGATGAGKSAGLNCLISSLLYRNTPRELKFLMIDPKKVELSLYEGIPHLASPVITNVKQAPSLFKQAIREMEQRYDKFAKVQTRNIEGFNAKVEEEERLPYWVIVVDELADLMMTSGPEIEQYICRLAQLSRATGIHLVIATQRPSVNVITGTIKANIPSRIAFAMNSAVDSRTIIDSVGADRLIGRGDMLYMPMDAAKPTRLQGCFVSEGETEALVNFLKQQGQPNFEVLPSSLSLATGEDDSGETSADDELFEHAVRLVVTGGSASTSMLQRRFKIGYTRAARLIDIMEQRGIVGALDGAKPRDILKSRDEIDAMFSGEGSREEG